MNRRDFLKGTAVAGLISRIGVAEDVSARPIKWTIHTNNPVIRPGQINPGLDDRRAGAAHVIQLGDTYRMYYWGSGNKGNVICMAETSVAKPNNWRGLGHVLAPQPETQHNSGGPSFPHVVPLDKSHWLMFFCAWGRKRDDGKLPNTTCLAESSDGGITWKYHGNEPIIPNDKPYDRDGAGSCWVVKTENEFRMYYTAIAEYFQKPDGVRTGHGNVIPRIGIGYMVSTDGLTWKKPLDDFLVKPRLAETRPYNYIASKPCVIRDGNLWRMWVSTFGHAYRVRSLVSRDGIEWSWVESGEDGDLGIGKLRAFDDHQRCYACVVKHASEYRCWYTANGFGQTGMGYATGT